jgi:hypothetical protein
MQRAVKLSAARHPRGRETNASISEGKAARATPIFQQFCYLNEIEQRVWASLFKEQASPPSRFPK